MRVNVVGLGYIGLPTALMLASNGISVIGTDINQTIVDKLNNKQITFEEVGLDDIFSNAIKNGIEFTNEFTKADCYIVAVPTPYITRDKTIDPQYIVSAIKSILEVCGNNTIIVIESTISPGTIDKFVRPLIKKKIKEGKVVNIAHAPERIIPGNMIKELIYNSRVIGVDCSDVGKKICQLYSSFCRSDIVITDIKTAEMSKVVENTYRDINIAFANELAKICRIGNMNVYEIIRIANMHPRVNILQPGPGVGGHCISVDPWFLVGDYPGLANIILAARKINDSMPEFVLERISTIMEQHNIKDISRVGLYGLTYKENVDDVRESPTLQLLEIMRKHLAFGIKLYDPMIKKQIVDNQFQSFEEFVDAVDLIVIMVGHSHIINLKDKIQNKIILDTRNVLKLDNAYFL